MRQRHQQFLLLATLTLAAIKAKIAGDAPEENESNTFGLPNGDPLRKVLRRLITEQTKKMVGFVAKLGAEIPDSFPSLADYDDPMASAMTPILGLYWSKAGRALYGRLGLDPDEWRVTDPHLHQAIAEQALDFCSQTNATTDQELGAALGSLREELQQGLVTEGEAIPQLAQRVQKVFTRLSKVRATTIARTEAARAVHQAALRSAAESGVVAGKRWLTSANSCKLCHRLADDVGVIPLDQTFAVVGQHQSYSQVRHPPAHPHCRCSMTFELTDPASDPVMAFEVPPEPAPVAAPEPEPPVVNPVPDLANRAAYAAYARRAIAAADSGLIPAGPIADRLARHRAGDVAIVHTSAIHDHYAPQVDSLRDLLESHQQEIGRAIRDKGTAQSILEGYGPRSKTAAAIAARAQVESTTAALELLKRNRDRDKAEHGRLIAERDDRIHEILAGTPGHKIHSQIGPITNGYYAGRNVSQDVGEGSRRSIAAGNAFVEQQFHKTADEDKDLRVEYHHETPRAHCRSAADGEGRKSQINVAQHAEGTRVVVHELGHAIEHQYPSIGQRSHEFLAYRVGDEVPRSLREEFGENSGFDAHEMGRTDDFGRAFGSRASYVGKDYGVHYTEILSMGLEQYYDNPGQFAQADPEFFKFVHGVMTGAVR